MKRVNKTKKIILAIFLLYFGTWLIVNVHIGTIEQNNGLTLETAYGDDQAYHPKLLCFEDGWNGYKYWMSYTPYPYHNAIFENPSIAVSNDLVNWSVPNGMTSPLLDDLSENGDENRYNSDSNILYNIDTDSIECWWRYVDDVDNKMYIYRTITNDGINWSEKEVCIQSDNRKELDYVSPAVMKMGSIVCGMLIKEKFGILVQIIY